MKRVAKFVSIVLILSIIIVSCKKDDDRPVIPVAKLSSVKYTTNKLDGKVKMALNSKNATVTPKNASVAFTISKITLDKKSFANPKSGGFLIDSKGTISAPNNHKLGKGEYVLTITATTKKNKKDKKNKAISKTTLFTVVLSEAVTAISSISYAPTMVEGKQKVALTTKSATVEPKGVLVSFRIVGIKKGDKSFINPKVGGFKIGGQGGNISLSKDHKLTAGTYILNIIGTNKKDKKDKKKAKVTIVIK